MAHYSDRAGGARPRALFALCACDEPSHCGETTISNILRSVVQRMLQQQKVRPDVAEKFGYHTDFDVRSESSAIMLVYLKLFSPAVEVNHAGACATLSVAKGSNVPMLKLELTTDDCTS